MIDRLFAVPVVNDDDGRCVTCEVRAPTVDGARDIACVRMGFDFNWRRCSSAPGTAYEVTHEP